MFGIFNLINTSISFVFPIYASYKSLETNDVNKIKPWLIYWVVFGTFTLCENVFGFVLDIIPLYSFFKSGFLVWLVLPLASNGNESGCGFLYYSYFKPWLDTNLKGIDSEANQNTSNDTYLSSFTSYLNSKFNQNENESNKFTKNDIYSQAAGFTLGQLGKYVNQAGATAPIDNKAGNENMINDVISRFQRATNPHAAPVSGETLDHPTTNLISSFLSMVAPNLNTTSFNTNANVPDQRVINVEHTLKEIKPEEATENKEDTSMNSLLNESEFDVVDKFEIDNLSINDNSKSIPSTVPIENQNTGWFWFSNSTNNKKQE